MKGAQEIFPHAPHRGLTTGGGLELGEDADTNGQQTSGQKHRQQGIARHDIKHGADKLHDGGHSGNDSVHASRNSFSLGDYLLYCFLDGGVVYGFY